MLFTMKFSLNEILSQAGPAMKLFFPNSLLDLIPEENRDLPLEVWADDFQMPWGAVYPFRELIEDANKVVSADTYWVTVPLWDLSGFTIAGNDIHSVCLFIPKSSLEGTRPAVLICPGGGYETIAFHHEGFETAKRLETKGYRTFILNYRLSPNHFPAPQLDLALAIKHIRANAGQYRIDSQNLMILGYSAGGHLCASTTALRNELEPLLEEEMKRRLPSIAEHYRDIPIRPDKVCLCYPVISFLEEDHEPSFQALTGGREKLREHLSIEKQIDQDFPKTFLWTCADDSLVPPSNASRMDQALSSRNIPHRYRLYPQGEHGCSLGIGTSAEGWIDEMTEYML